MRNTVKFTLFSALFLLFSGNLFARENYAAWCQQGNQTVAAGGLTSSTKVQRSFPTCTVTVYLAGTVTFATLYSDEAGTPLTNPFTNQSTTTGQYFFFADNGYYDVQISAVGLTTYTLRKIGLGGSGGIVQNCAGFAGVDAGAQIDACITALPSTGGTADARGLQGAGLVVSSTIVINKPVRLLLGSATYTVSASPMISTSSALDVDGAGKYNTYIQESGLSGNLFNVASQSAFHLSKLTIQSQAIPGGQTSGAAVTITGSGSGVGQYNQNSLIEQCIFIGQWIAIDSGRMATSWITNNSFFNVRFRAVRLNNTVNGDEGDNWILHNTMSSNPTPSSMIGIEYIAGGGLMIDDNKFQIFNYAIQVNWNTAADTSQLSIHGNNFEAQATGGAAISMNRSSGSIAGISIIGNFYNTNAGGFGNFMDIPANGTLWMPQLVVADNNIALGSAGIGFNITGFGPAQGIFANNHVAGNGGTSQAFNFGLNIASIRLWGNTNYGCGLDNVILSGLRGNYEDDNIGLAGVSPAIALTNPLNLANNTALVSRNAANSEWDKLIYQDGSDNLILAANNQPIVTGTGTATFQGFVSSAHYKTASNCITNASPAACTNLTAGVVGIPAGTSTIQVNTTAVTANSEIYITIDTAHNIGTTCDTGTFLTVPLYLVAINPGVSFTIGTSAVVTALKAGCSHFLIVN